jgi:hypothetical protein
MRALRRGTPSARVPCLVLRPLSNADDLSKLTDAELDNRLRALNDEKHRRQSTLIIGAAGAIGKRLCAALTARGHRVIASDRMEQVLSGAM